MPETPDTPDTPTTFLRLLAADDKSAAMLAAVAAINAAAPAPDVYTVDPASFGQIPGSPFAYWVSESVRDLFSQFPSFEREGQDIQHGLATTDDFQFVRTWWEVSPAETFQGESSTSQNDYISQSFHGKEWVSFLKGGSFSRYYADPHLVLRWGRNGELLKAYLADKCERLFGNRNWSRWINSFTFYFRPALTWPRRTTSSLSVRQMPSGSIFSEKGSTIFAADDSHEQLCALLSLVNSVPFAALLELQLGAADVAARSYEVGLIQRTPVPNLSAEDSQMLAALAREAHDLKREADRDDEVTHPFTAPALARLRLAGSLAQGLSALAAEDAARERRLAEIQREIDDRCFALYGFSAEDRAQVEGNAGQVTAATVMGAETDAEADAERADDDDENGDENGDGVSASHPQGQGAGLPIRLSASRAAADLLMYAVGCAFGRWDVRIGREPSLAPRLADPFAPLPVCAPGTLVGPDGLPATAGDAIVSEAWLRARPDAITLPAAGSVSQPTIAAGEYPIPIAWDGILVDDADAQDDIVRRVRATLDHLWGDDASAIEGEACAMLGVQDLRDSLRNPRGFFDHHISRYSKSRRKAPVYWLLQSPKRHYGIWLYYHRLDADLVFKALTLYLLPKIRQAEQRLTELETARKAAGSAGADARRVAQAVDRHEALLADLREFYAALDRAARYYLTPDLNDGVLLNIAPFWEVVPWKEAKSAWQQLLAGKYGWSSIGKQLREKGHLTVHTS